MTRPIAAAVAVLLAAAACPTQPSVRTEDSARCASVAAYLDGARPTDLVCVQYGSPPWKAEYEARVRGGRPGDTLRLGKDFWTTFDSSVELEVAGVRVPAGPHYLALRRREVGFALLFLDPADVIRARVLPASPDRYPGGIAVPLQLAEEEAVNDSLGIHLRRAEGGLKLEIAWGRHRLTASIRAGGAVADLPPVANRMRPGHAPTPFSAAEIRAGCPAGRRVRYRIEQGDAVRLQTLRFVESTPEQAVFLVSMTTEDGEPVGEPQRGQAPWEELQSHATFPAAATAITSTEVTVPAGTFRCWLYVVTNAQGVRRLWFAKELPGPPVRSEQESPDGRLRRRMVMLESRG